MGPVSEPTPSREPCVNSLGGFIIALGERGDVYTVLAAEVPDLSQVGNLDNLLAFAFEYNL